jgi:hypothetical protein
VILGDRFGCQPDIQVDDPRMRHVVLRQRDQVAEYFKARRRHIELLTVGVLGVATLQYGREQCFLAWEVVDQTGVGDARAFGDLTQGGTVVAGLAVHGDGGADDVLPAQPALEITACHADHRPIMPRAANTQPI